MKEKKAYKRWLYVSDTEYKVLKNTAIIVLLFFTVICTIRIIQSEGARSEGSEGVADADFTKLDLNTLDQEGHITAENLKDYDLTLINFWRTTCTFCIKEMPALNELSKEYEGRVQFIGVCEDVQKKGVVDDEKLREALHIISTKGENFMQTYPTAGFTEMTDQILGVPETYFVDRDGNILKVISGAMDKAGWKNEIDGILEDIGGEQ
ncbi:MAG: TlpA family protein disulfide reductase [Clostridia bacterium]|nr:TlpA family protein disulfide reductase [Clostridia bacterium]